jgi:membrane-associated phospholipid phosphatase
MQALNVQLFQWIAAGHAPDSTLLWLASLLASGTSWVCFALVGWAAWRQPRDRAYLMATLFACGAASLAAHALADAIHMPRPFVLGLSPSYIDHGARGAMPSAHASVMFTLAFVLCLRPSLRRLGGVVVAIAVLTGWARVYVGVHFPLDVLGGLLLGALIAAVFAALQWSVRRWIAPMVARDAAMPAPRP